jgi:hypothetical protein
VSCAELDELGLSDKSVGVDADAPVTWAFLNMTCMDSKLSGP